jgi:MFS family permease
MQMCGLSLSDSNHGIQWHIVAMYGASFLTGPLIARFGPLPVAGLGLVLEVIAALIDLSGTTALHFWSGLIVLGLGWNFGFIGASAMVLETHRDEERTRVQSFNDFLIFGTMALGSFASGGILTAYGWTAVNLVVFPPVVLALAVLIWAARRSRAASRAPS